MNTRLPVLITVLLVSQPLLYLYAAGYDPTALATMFEKLEAKNKKKPGTIANIFADHPAPANRRAASLALAAQFPEREEYVINTAQFNQPC